MINKKQKEFGKWLKELRVSAGLKQADLAARLGFPGGFSQSIANIESGRVQFPKKYWASFCDLLGIDRNLFIEKFKQTASDPIADAFAASNSKKPRARMAREKR